MTTDIKKYKNNLYDIKKRIEVISELPFRIRNIKTEQEL